VTLPGCHTRGRARRSSTESGPGPAQSRKIIAHPREAGVRPRAITKDIDSARPLTLSPPTTVNISALNSCGPATGLLSVEQRVALHRLGAAHPHGADGDGDVELARGIYAIAHPDSRRSENHAALGAALLTLRQQGLADRRHHLWSDGRTTVPRRHESDSGSSWVAWSGGPGVFPASPAAQCVEWSPPEWCTAEPLVRGVA